MHSVSNERIGILKIVSFVLSRLKEERQKANMSQIELSLAAVLSQNQVNCIES